MTDEKPFSLRTQRLRFRWWRRQDLELAMALWGDVQVTRLFDARGQLDRTQVASRLEHELATAQRHGVQYWPAFLLQGGAFVGCCGLRPHDPQGGDLEFGVHLRPSYWRQGLAQEAGRAIIAHAFASLGVAALFAGHHPDNQASCRLLARLGFHYTHDELFAATGRQHRSYQLLHEDWVASRNAVDNAGGNAG